MRKLQIVTWLVDDAIVGPVKESEYSAEELSDMIRKGMPEETTWVQAQDENGTWHLVPGHRVIDISVREVLSA